MSLIAWFPLNGNLNNIGINSDIKMSIPSGVSVNDQGKIGKCYSFNGTTSSYATIEYTSNANFMSEYINGPDNDFSVAFWFKSPGMGTDQTVGGLFGFTYGVLCDLSSDRIFFRLYNTDGAIFATLNGNYQDNKWHHCVCIKKFNSLENKTYAYLYMDGSLGATASRDGAYSSSWSNSIRLGNNPNDNMYHFLGFMNDFRIYDEAISQKEIKELYKCCILHYDFNDPYIEPTTNLCTTIQTTLGKWGNNDATSEAFTAPDGTIGIHKQCTSFTDGGWSHHNMTPNVIGGQTYTYSAKIKYNAVPHRNILYIYQLNSSNSVITEGGLFSTSNQISIGNNWYQIWGTITLNSATTKVHLRSFEYKVNDIYMYDFQFEQKDHFTTYTPNFRCTNFLTGALTTGGRAVISGNTATINWTVNPGDTYFYLNLLKTLEPDKKYRIKFNVSGLGSSSVCFLVGNRVHLKIYLTNGTNTYDFYPDIGDCATVKLLFDDWIRDDTLSNLVLSDFTLEEIPCIYDSSGLSNDGYVEGNLIVNNNSILGTHCYNFNNSAYIKRPSITSEAKTLSIWVFSEVIQNATVIFADKKSGLGLGFYYSGTAFIVSCKDTNTFLLNGKYNINNWNHVVVVFGSSDTYCYLNGNLLPKNGSNTNSWTHSIDELNIACRYTSDHLSFFTGKIADLKLFATSLSAEDVLQLYKSKAQISKNGKLFINTIDEVPENKNVVINANNLFNVIHLSSTDFEAVGWATPIMLASDVGSYLKPNTTYYYHYKIRVLNYPISHFYTQQTWASFLFYGGTSENVSFGGISSERYFQTNLNDIIEVKGSFISPSDLTEKQLLFYTARLSGDINDWVPNFELIKMRIMDFEISSTPFEHTNPKLVSNKSVANAYQFEELPEITLTNYIENPDTLSSVTMNSSSGSGSISNGVLTRLASVQYDDVIFPDNMSNTIGVNRIKNDKLYISFETKFTSSQGAASNVYKFYANDNVNQGGPGSVNTTVFTRSSAFYTIKYNATMCYMRIQDNRASGWTEYQAKHPMLINMRESGLYNLLERLGYNTDVLKKQWIDENIPFFVGTYKIPKDKLKVMKSGEIISSEFNEH